MVPVDSHVTVPAIVTGADYSHFKESMNLVRNLNDGVRKAYKDMKLIYFDLGLAQHQKDHVSSFREFSFGKLRMIPVACLRLPESYEGYRMQEIFSLFCVCS